MHRLLLASLLLLLTTACGTVSHGTMQRIDVTSDPPGAEVRVHDCGTRTVAFTTPGHFVASRKATRCTLRFTAEGYVPFEMTLARVSSTGAAVDAGAVVTDVLYDPAGALESIAVAGAVVGTSLAIDWATGGLYELSPSDFEVYLEPVGESELKIEN